MEVADRSDGSHRLYAAACRCAEHDLNDAEAISVIREYASRRPFPQTWSDDDIAARLRDAEKRCRRGLAAPAGDAFRPQPLSVRELLAGYPELRPPVVHGLLREGETMNVVAATKIGKTWLVTDLAYAIATATVDEFREKIKEWKQLFLGTDFQSQMKIDVNGETVNSETMLSKWLNAHQFHRDRDKQRELEALRDWFPDHYVKGVFVSMAIDKAKAVLFLAKFIRWMDTGGTEPFRFPGSA